SFGIEPAFLQDYLGLGGHKGAQARSYPTPVRESEVVNSSEMMELGDGFVGGFFPQLYINDGSRFLGRTRAVAEVGGVNGPYKDKPGSTARAKSRHRGRGNVVFCDGHVESPTLEMLFVSMGEADLSRWNRDHQPHLDRLEHR
ncbi:MAG TPA: H-X9-DG-CTERM domain-containing protein, partial [Verrucomicrobiae bacterium]|nr:H-X9-DG-CTERM domain-containing protein [Verrucomicrobiae bacterium]